MYQKYHAGSGGLSFSSRGTPDIRGCLTKIFKGCLLLAFIGVLSIFCFGTFLVTDIIPMIIAGKPGNLPAATGLAVDHLKEERTLPSNVILSPELKSLGNSKGFDTIFGRQYQLQACIAAAERLGIQKRHLCALMDMEGGWPSELVAKSYVDGISRAMVLRSFGYDPSDPVVRWEIVELEICEDEICEIVEVRGCLNDTCEAILQYFGGNPDYMEVFLQKSQEWRKADGAEIDPLPSKNAWLWFFPLTIKYHTLLNLGYGIAYEVDGVTVVVVGGAPPPNSLPDMEDATFVWPVSGGYISGHRYGISFGGLVFPEHTGLDAAGGDGWVRTAHNGRVTFSDFVDYKSTFAADIWSSGNQVIVKSEFSDGTPFCTGYGHGANLLVKVGQEVRAGDVLFLMGDTGKADGIHVHFFIRIGGTGDYCSGGYFIDPEAILP